jgi:hypothetical protein
VDFKVSMEFNPTEIATMILEYNEDQNVGMNEKEITEISEKLYYYTSGYPFLVSRLCQIVVNDILPTKENSTKKLTSEDIEKAFNIIQKEVNTNFESLIKNLQNNSDLYDLVSDMLLEGRNVPFSPHNKVIEKGIMYGVFKQNGKIKINNPIYEQIIYDYLVVNADIEKVKPSYFTDHQFILPNKELNLELVLQRFQVYMKESYSQKEESFLENQWRLIFMSFLFPILNGNGFAFKEVQISEERRLDVVVTYHHHKYIIELKVWRGESYHERGINQLCDYLDKQNQDTGYLVIFNEKQKKELNLKSEWIEIEGKRIFMIFI